MTAACESRSNDARSHDRPDTAPAACNSASCESSASVCNLSAVPVAAFPQPTMPVFCTHDSIVHEMPRSLVRSCTHGTGVDIIDEVSIWSTSEGMQCVVCVVHAAIITEHDLAECRSLVERAISSGDANASLFVATGAVAWPGLAYFELSTWAHAPAAYLSMSALAGSGFGVGLRALQAFWGQSQCGAFCGDASESSDSLLARVVQRRREHLAEDKLSLTRRRRLLHEAQEHIDADECRLAQATRDLWVVSCAQGSDTPQTHTLADTPDSAPAHPRQHDIDGLVCRVLQAVQFKKNGELRWPNRIQAGISEAQARSSGGFRSLLAIAKLRFASRGAE